MAITPTPLYQSKGNVPYIPTGYEGLRSDIASKRKIAEAMMAAGMAGPGVNARSWVQLLGSLAQSFAGTMMDRKANREETDMNNNISINQGVSEANFNSAQAMGATNDELTRQFGSDPNLADNPMMKIVQELALKGRIAKGDPYIANGPDGKPRTYQGYEDGHTSPVEGGMTLRPTMTMQNNVATDLQGMTDGQVGPQNLNEDIIRGPDGKPQINTAAVVAKQNIQGFGSSAPGVTWGDGSQAGSGISGAAPSAVAPAPGVAGVTNALTNRKGGFAEAIKTILGNEGGYAAHDMNGAAVNFGINQAANPGVDVRNLTRDQATQIYHDKYWVKSGAETLPTNLQTPYFDAYIRNPAKAQQFLQASGGDPATFVGMATSYFKDLAAKPGNEKYQRAYATRDAQNMAIATGGQGQGNPALPPAAGGSPITMGTPLPGSPAAARLGKTTVMTSDQIKVAGLDPSKVYQQKQDGTITTLGPRSDGVTEPDKVMGDTTKRGAEYLSTLPVDHQGLVQSIVDGKFPMSARMVSKSFLPYFKEASIVAGVPIDATTYARRAKTQADMAISGQGGKAMMSFATAINHMYDYAKAVQALHQGPTVGLNSATQTFSNYIQADPRYADVNQALTPLSEELPRVYNGGNKAGTIPEIAQTRKDWSPNSGEVYARKSVSSALSKMTGRYGPLINQYKLGMSSNSDITKLVDQYLPGSSVKMQALEEYAKTGKFPDEGGSSAAPTFTDPNAQRAYNLLHKLRGGK